MFSIDVPCGDAQLIKAPAAPVTPGQIPDDALVLLVDDESAILRGMAELFDNWHIDLVTAHSADEAMQWLDSIGRVPDVIVSDYRLPDDTDGIEVITRLRQKYGPISRPSWSRATPRPTPSCASARPAFRCCTSRCAPPSCAPCSPT